MPQDVRSQPAKTASARRSGLLGFLRKRQTQLAETPRFDLADAFKGMPVEECSDERYQAIASVRKALAVDRLKEDEERLKSIHSRANVLAASGGALLAVSLPVAGTVVKNLTDPVWEPKFAVIYLILTLFFLARAVFSAYEALQPTPYSRVPLDLKTLETISSVIPDERAGAAADLVQAHVTMSASETNSRTLDRLTRALRFGFLYLSLGLLALLTAFGSNQMYALQKFYDDARKQAAIANLRTGNEPSSRAKTVVDGHRLRDDRKGRNPVVK